MTLKERATQILSKDLAVAVLHRLGTQVQDVNKLFKQFDETHEEKCVKAVWLNDAWECKA